MSKTELELLASRQNHIIDIRLPQLKINLLGLNGGRPYIESRLTRFPAESPIEWEGSSGVRSEGRFSTSINVVGRKQRAYLVNHCARVAEKIKQYVFSTPPQRAGADEEFLMDVTRNGTSINDFMGKICNLITANEWAWIGIDAPRMVDRSGQPVQISLKAKQEGKIRPYWAIYNATEVVDWHYNEVGELDWLMTEGIIWVDADARHAAEKFRIRRLWEPREMTEYYYKIADDGTGESSLDPTKTKIFPVDFPKVPFVRASDLSADPWWFDDVESLNRAIMDHESANDEAFFKQVYPQKVVPQSMIDEVKSQLGNGANLAEAIDAVLGMSIAIVESPDEKGISRYIMPDGGSLEVGLKELDRKRRNLFETVGLALQINTKQVASAESKAWDHLDPEAVLKERAQQLEEAETKAVNMTKEWDSSFKEYEPSYSKKFDISNILEDIKGLTLGAQIDMPDGMRRVLVRALYEKVKKLSGVSMSPQEDKEIIQEIEEMETSVPIEMAPTPPVLPEEP